MAESTSFGSGGLFNNRALFSLLLLIFTQIFVQVFFHTCYEHNGSAVGVYNEFMSMGVMEFLGKATFPYFDPLAWKIIVTYSLFEIFLLKFVPGKTFHGPRTPTGHIPVYPANGVQCYVISIVVLLAGFYTGHIPLSMIYDNMGKLIAASNFAALCLCVFLSVKGLYFPSTKDHGSNGNLIVDFFWGTELHPSILGINVKQFTNCRYGMMFWQLGLLCYAAKQYEDLGYISSSMAVSVALQTIYIAKFFVWETGYFCTMDIQHDRAGYYICWGCMVYLPCFYTIHTFFLAAHPVMLSLPVAGLIMAAGIFCIWWNYNCDYQRQVFRGPGGTDVDIWGAKPEYITATYTAKTGEKHTSLLLLSGWWGVARHIHYVPEIGVAFLWCLPALFTHALPYYYPFYLTILLLDRAFRDDLRCHEKYGKFWEQYCAKVPYKIIPGVV